MPSATAGRADTGATISRPSADEPRDGAGARATRGGTSLRPRAGHRVATPAMTPRSCRSRKATTLHAASAQSRPRRRGGWRSAAPATASQPARAASDSCRGAGRTGDVPVRPGRQPAGTTASRWSSPRTEAGGHGRAGDAEHGFREEARPDQLRERRQHHHQRHAGLDEVAAGPVAQQQLLAHATCMKWSFSKPLNAASRKPKHNKATTTAATATGAEYSRIGCLIART